MEQEALVAERDTGSAKQLSTSVRGFKGERIIKALMKVEEKKTKRMSQQEQVDFFTNFLVNRQLRNFVHF